MHNDAAAPVGLVRRSERATRVATALAGVALTVLVGFGGLTDVGEPLVTLSYDMPFIVHRSGGMDDIRMVYLTELGAESLDRRPQARLLDRLREEGARMVVYDLIFDRASGDPAVDLEFAAAMRRFRGVDENGRAAPGAAEVADEDQVASGRGHRGEQFNRVGLIEMMKKERTRDGVVPSRQPLPQGVEKKKA